MDFFVSDWSSTLRCAKCIDDKEIFVTVRNDGYKIFCRDNVPSCVETPEICPHQEEADTKMFLCAAFPLTLGFNSVCIVTIDTDILILGCYFSNKLEGNLFIKLQTKPANYCNAFPGYHAVTGCNCTSSFYGLGKTKGLKLLKDNRSFH